MVRDYTVNRAIGYNKIEIKMTEKDKLFYQEMADLNGMDRDDLIHNLIKNGLRVTKLNVPGVTKEEIDEHPLSVIQEDIDLEETIDKYHQKVIKDDIDSQKD